MKRWFEPVDEGGWQAKPELARFVVGDLLRTGRCDPIMCRDTVIYFTEEVRDALHARLTSPFHFISRKRDGRRRGAARAPRARPMETIVRMGGLAVSRTAEPALEVVA